MSAYDATFALCVAELRGEVSLRDDLAATEWRPEMVETLWGLDRESHYDDDASTFARAYGIVLHDALDAPEAP